MQETERTTRQRYLIAALELFSTRGYEAVSLSDIAEAVGLTRPALYKHFKSKQELFDAIVSLSDRGFSSRMGRFGVSFTQDPKERAAFFRMSEEEQIRMIQQLFLYTLGDEYPALFRKLMTVEQFKQPQLAALCNRHYVDAQFEAFEKLMQDGIDRGYYPAGSARAMAIQYISPVIVLVGVCDRAPEREDEALALIAEHIRQFDRIYRQAEK